MRKFLYSILAAAIVIGGAQTFAPTALQYTATYLLPTDTISVWRNGQNLKAAAAIFAPRIASTDVVLTAQAYTATAADIGTRLRVTTGATDATITLPGAAASKNGAVIYVEKVDTDVGKVIINSPTASNIAWLFSSKDFVQFLSNGTAWQVFSRQIAPVAQVFTATGTWTKPPLLTRVQIFAIGGGAGGSSGMLGPTSSDRLGGGGGASGNVVNEIKLASSVTTGTVTVGGPAAGGAGQTSNGTPGNPGTAGNATTFGTIISARGGSASSAGGGTTTGPGGIATGASGNVSISSAAGGGSSLTAAGGVGNSGPAGSGAGGGAITAANTIRSGAAGGVGSSYSFSRPAGGLAGTACAAGGAGNDISDSTLQVGGSGGGSSPGCSSGPSGAGGNGGFPGGAGGGSGASLDGFATGKGGDGAGGEAIFTMFFD